MNLDEHVRAERDAEALRRGERFETLRGGVDLAKAKVEREEAGERRGWVIAAHRHTLGVLQTMLMQEFG